MTNDKRLIEYYIPIKAISAEASREKSIRHGHISTLHLWWARRPLVASRAAVFAALVPWDAKPQLMKPASESEEKRPYTITEFMVELCKWEVRDEVLDEARRLIREAYPDNPPKVLDMFAGGGSIPLEALRLGCEAYALDLNPVAHIIELATLVYPQKYGSQLAEDVKKWGEWVLERVRAEVGDLYPLIPDPEFTPEKAATISRMAKQPRLFPSDEPEQMEMDFDALTPGPSPTRGEGSPLTPGPTGGEGSMSRAERIVVPRGLEIKMRDLARTLRKEATPSEEVLWQALRNRQLEGRKFRRQQPVGAFVLDFYCAEERLAVEVDGPIHETQRDADALRQEMLESLGIRFVRLTADEVERHLDIALSRIRAAFRPLTLNPSPTGGEGLYGAHGASLPRGKTGNDVDGFAFLRPSWEKGLEDEGDDDEDFPSPFMGEGAGGEGQIPFGYLQPVAYLWTRTVTCPNPACRASVPLVRQTWLKKKKGDNVALAMKPHPTENRMAFYVRHAREPEDFGFDPAGFSQRGNSVCGRCGTTVTSDTVKQEGKAGRMGAQMMATVCVRPGERGKVYLSPDEHDLPVPDDAAIQARIEALTAETGITPPDEEIGGSTRDFFTPLYGLTRFSDLFTLRQMFTLLTFVKYVRVAHAEMSETGLDAEYAKAITTYLGLTIDKIADYSTNLCRWVTGGEFVSGVYARQALPMVWDYAEANTFGGTSGSFKNLVRWMLLVLDTSVDGIPSTVRRGSATALPFDHSSIDNVITDPPYYDNISYSDLSDFYYVWLKRSLGFIYKEHFGSDLAPKKQEAIVADYRHETADIARDFYENMMLNAFQETYRVLKPNGLLVTVYAHKTTAGWSTLIDALRRAGFSVIEAWPLDTERPSRSISIDTAALASSFFLVARKRDDALTLNPSPTRGEGLEKDADSSPAHDEGLEKDADSSPARGAGLEEDAAPLSPRGRGAGGEGVSTSGRGAGGEGVSTSGRGAGGEGNTGDFVRDVEPEMRRIVGERVRFFLAQGITGADLNIAAVGAGLAPYTRYARVELPNGEELTAAAYLDEVQSEVIHALLGETSQTDPATQYYIMGRDYYGEAWVDFDEANTLARATGVELDSGPEALARGKDALVEKKGSKIRLRDYAERGESDSLGLPTPEHLKAPLIDVLHRLLWLAENDNSGISDLLAEAMPDKYLLRLTAQTLGGKALASEPTPGAMRDERSREQRAIDSLLAGWRRVIDEGKLM